jgi:formylmethanofuran dehydrogenase subunit E
MADYQEKIRQFHGHIGPYVVLGYRMGKYAKLRLTEIERITVQIDQRPPISCIIDGLQMATGCTLGKNKIRLLKDKKFKKAVFYSKSKKIRIILTTELQLLLKKSQKSALKFIKQSKYADLFKLD